MIPNEWIPILHQLLMRRYSVILTRKFQYVCELEEKGKQIKWEGQTNLIKFVIKSWRVKHWLGSSCLSLAINVPIHTRGSKCPYRTGGGCRFLGSGWVLCQVSSTSLQRQKEGKQEPTALDLHRAGVSPLTLRQFNYVTINRIHISPVTVFPETAQIL